MDLSLIYRWSHYIFCNPPSYFITITFKDSSFNRYPTKWRYSDDEAISLTNRLLHFVNHQIFGRRYKQKNRFLHGVGCLEYQANHNPHFHLLINNKFLPLYRIERAFLSKIQKFNIFDSSGFDYQKVNPDDIDLWRISKYVTKAGKMVVLGKDGILA